MYARRYGEDVFTFEASGGLIDAALVMNDDETQSYWGIMQGQALTGPKAGLTLRELPGASKLQWRDWVARHPDTQVLSVRGAEDVPGDPYANYFASDGGFRGLQATDRRLATKAPVYAFRRGERAFAAPFTSFEDGGAFELSEAGGNTVSVFLHRPKGASNYRSTSAWTSQRGFAERDGGWVELGSGARFDPRSGGWSGGGGQGPVELTGFDTFWYVWSLANPDTQVLVRAGGDR